MNFDLFITATRLFADLRYYSFPYIKGIHTGYTALFCLGFYLFYLIVLSPVLVYLFAKKPRKESIREAFKTRGLKGVLKVIHQGAPLSDYVLVYLIVYGTFIAAVILLHDFIRYVTL